MGLSLPRGFCNGGIESLNLKPGQMDSLFSGSYERNEQFLLGASGLPAGFTSSGAM